MRNLKDKFDAEFSFIVGLLVVLAVGIPLCAQIDARYGIAETKDVMVAMHDGVKLAADIYRPTQNGQLVDGKFPVILLRTPYNKEDSVQIANSFVPHGYVVVLQDVRGRYKSEGHWRPHVDDPNDGFDTAQWIGSQPWFDGGIGTLGSSYEGATQHALAIGNAPYIKAMVPRNAMSDYRRAPGGQTRRSRSGRRKSAGGNGRSSPRLCSCAAFASRHNSAQVRSRLRVLADRSHEPRRLRRFLE